MSDDEEIIEISGEIRAETDKAILFYDGATEVWIPKSQIRNEELPDPETNFELEIPEWLAEAKGLV